MYMGMEKRRIGLMVTSLGRVEHYLLEEWNMNLKFYFGKTYCWEKFCYGANVIEYTLIQIKMVFKVAKA